jgi:hypothetical protein
MSDIGKTGDAVTLPSTWYFLKLVFMFISCIIMNIFMFNYCSNINTCTWIVSLTVILKCLFNYEIKKYQNIAYLLTPTVMWYDVCEECYSSAANTYHTAVGICSFKKNIIFYELGLR